MQSGYSDTYTSLGRQFRIRGPTDAIIEFMTGRGHHSTGPMAGSMTIIGHILGRLLYGKRLLPNSGLINFPIFKITPIGMRILEMCHNNAEGHFVSRLN